jgi:hypothetical protein
MKLFLLILFILFIGCSETPTAPETKKIINPIEPADPEDSLAAILIGGYWKYEGGTYSEYFTFSADSAGTWFLYNYQQDSLIITEIEFHWYLEIDMAGKIFLMRNLYEDLKKHEITVTDEVFTVYYSIDFVKNHYWQPNI